MLRPDLDNRSEKSFCQCVERAMLLTLNKQKCVRNGVQLFTYIKGPLKCKPTAMFGLTFIERPILGKAHNEKRALFVKSMHFL